jgi:hypothetical protein
MTPFLLAASVGSILQCGAMPCDLQLVHQYLCVIQQQGKEELGSRELEGSSLRKDSDENMDSSTEDSDGDEENSEQEEMRKKRRTTR